MINFLGASMQIGLRALALFVDDGAARETVEPIGGGSGMGFVARDQMREAQARCRRRP